MPNHFHIIIKDVGKNLPLIMDTINSVYARYYDEKYNHKGSVFDGPFKSKPVLTNYDFIRLYRYIMIQMMEDLIFRLLQYLIKVEAPNVCI